MPDKSIWQEFFDAHAPDYNGNVFTRNTAAEIDFLVEELALPPGAAVLDLGCGTGRHSVGLARRGFRMTGLDLSPGMLAQADAAAKAAGVQVEWVQADAAAFEFPQRFDAAIGLCEGSLGLLGAGDDPIGQPLAVLRNVASSLKPGAPAIFTVLNASAMIRRHQDADVAAGRFDPLAMVETNALSPREGAAPVMLRERAFTPTELVLLFRTAGLSVHHLWGGTSGNWGRRPLLLDEMEIMAVARK